MEITFNQQMCAGNPSGRQGERNDFCVEGLVGPSLSLITLTILGWHVAGALGVL